MRLIMIDSNTGYIWGDTADLPGADLSGLTWREAAEAAARALDEGLGAAGRSYEVLERSPRDGSTGYHVYRVDVRGSEVVPVVQDGQDREVIEAVERGDDRGPWLLDLGDGHYIVTEGEYLAYVRCVGGEG